MRATAKLTLLAAIGALLVPASAAAALPRPSTASIVPRTSIGGVTLTTSQARIFALWGPGQCITQDAFNGRTCVWHAARTMTLPPEGAVVQFRNGRLCHVHIQAGVPLRGGPLAVTRLRNWKTSRGIGLGSSMTAVRRAYGRNFLTGAGGVTFSFLPGVRAAYRNTVTEMNLWKPPCRATA